MALATAVKELNQKVRSTRRIRIRYFHRKFPGLQEFTLAALARWVEKFVASGELVPLNELTIDIDGSWENFRFPAPELP